MAQTDKTEKTAIGAGNPQPRESESNDTHCPRCGESQQLAKVKGCIKCLQCGFKFDCNGW